MSYVGIVVFTRIMDQGNYGEYSTYYAYVSILTVLIGGNLYYTLNNAYIERKKEIKQFCKSTLALSTIIMMIVSLVLFLLGKVILKRFSSFEIIMAIFHSYGFFVISYKVFSSNMENDYKTKRWLLLLPNTLQFLLALLFISIFPQTSYKARIAGSTLGICIIAITVYFRIMSAEGRLYNPEYWKYAISIAFPTIIMSLSFMLMQQCDRVMISNLCGSEDTAVYSVIYYIGYAVVAVDQAAAPVRQAWIFRSLDSGRTSETRKVQKWYLYVMTIMACILIMAGPEIVKILAPEKYWQFEYVIPFVLSACIMLLYRFYVEIILFFKSNTLLSLCVSLCAILNIGLNALFIPQIGAIAACYTTVAAYGVLFLLTWILSIKHVKGLYSWSYFIFFILGLMIISFMYYILQGNITARYIALIIILAIILMYGWHTRKEWRGILWG